MKVHQTIPSDHFSKERLDSYLASMDISCSRNQAASFISDGSILVNYQKKKPGYRLKPGDVITGELRLDVDTPTVEPEPMDLDIRYVDKSILVIHKPAGLVVHPAPGNLSKTLVNGLLDYDPAMASIGKDTQRSGIVHRLDKDTSGLMVVARTSHALTLLQDEFKERRVEKYYLALTDGQIAEDTGLIELPIGRHPVKRKQMCVNLEAGRAAVSKWKLLKRFKSACLVEVQLLTGRTHQIRVHFHAIGHPLLGDPVYQFRRNRRGQSRFSRQMLHACRLSFNHPSTGQRMSFSAEPPKDFKAAIAGLEKQSGD